MTTERKLKLTIHYDGTAYHGWARQPGMPTIQGTLEEAFLNLCGYAVEVVGSSRTDAGVHALGQIAHAVLADCPIPTENFQNALNNLLPPDIAIADVQEVPGDFDAISDTISKRYNYVIHTGPVRYVLGQNMWNRTGPLDGDKMNKAAEFLIGKHDFKSFASAGDKRESSVRIISLCIVKQTCNMTIISVAADGFLYNMVRNIVGTLVEIGRGRWQPEYIKEILDARDRSAAGPIAPACGLCLMEIDY